MKDFIVLTAILPLLMAFIMQFTVDYRGLEEVQTIQNVVYTVKETAKEEGGFSEELINKIKNDISEKLGISSEQVRVSVATPEGKVGRFDDNRNINYRVEVELSEVMAAAHLFGISSKDNKRTYVIDSYTASEYVGGY